MYELPVPIIGFEPEVICVPIDRCYVYLQNKMYELPVPIIGFEPEVICVP